MPIRPPTKSDFPTSLTLTLTPPPPSQSTTSSSRPPPNILILLHGLGDTETPFTNLATSLQLSETTILTLRAPNPLPFDLPGFHWGDDINFDSRSGALDIDAGFAKSTKLLLEKIIRDVLVEKCGYKSRDIMILGFGQGGMLGLVLAEELSSSSSSSSSSSDSGEMGGMISIGAPYPLTLSSKPKSQDKKSKSRTPILILSGRDSEVVTESAIKRTKDVFEFVETHEYKRRGDTMPRSREEMMPVMRFFGRRLRSWTGVPEGAVEIS
ncbi:alpha/beta hydrolase [Aspergillus stella-maris]|uniref:alpha/beta hydrolase n=1 Tax=Aspergillus stella-maris TaxID=1810926 RepID=UPI003CCE0F1E